MTSYFISLNQPLYHVYPKVMFQKVNLPDLENIVHIKTKVQIIFR